MVDFGGFVLEIIDGHLVRNSIFFWYDIFRACRDYPWNFLL